MNAIPPAMPADAPDALPPRNRSVGHVIECGGMNAKIAATCPLGAESEDYWSVGQLITIRVDPNRVVGLLHKVEATQNSWRNDVPNQAILHVELTGEIQVREDQPPRFSSGVSQYPYLGAIAHRIRAEDLAAIYQNGDSRAAPIGVLSQNPGIPAVISLDRLVSRHFAVVGTTGTGKSTAVSMILRKIVQARPDLRVLILDPHDEFAHAFGEQGHVIRADGLDLPFWMLTLEEFAAVVFRGREPVAEELDALRDYIPAAKALYSGNCGQRALRKDGRGGATADTPTPYRMADLLSLLDEEIGALDGVDRRASLGALKSRLSALVHDPRFRFLFASRTVTDRMEDTLRDIYRLPARGKPVSIFQLSGIPSEVVDSIASVLCRLAFDLAIASDSRIKTLVVCEEAHRYIPADPTTAFQPTRAAVARIAKEGRKYGVSLAVITQRPHELDATILSQCNSVFALRLGNDADQDVMAKAISGSSRSAISFLSSLADREAIAFGAAVSIPMRMRFQTVNEASKPRSQNEGGGDTGGEQRATTLADIVESLRGGRASDDETEPAPAAQPTAQPAPRVAATAGARAHGLRKPLA